MGNHLELAMAKEKLAEDPRRYFEDSEYQQKIVEENTKISESDDKEEKQKLRKGLLKDIEPPKKKEKEGEQEEGEGAGEGGGGEEGGG